MEVKKIKEMFDYGYNSYHECNTDSDYEQHLKDCIETFNNGWIKIESEEDLPKEKGEYWIVNTIFKKPIMQMRAYPVCVFSEERNKEFWLKYISHYQPIEKPELPIY